MGHSQQSKVVNLIWGLIGNVLRIWKYATPSIDWQVYKKRFSQEGWA